jgi:hypothetical protein
MSARSSGAGSGQHRHPQLTEPVDGGQVELAHLDGAEGQFGGECPAVHLLGESDQLRARDRQFVTSLTLASTLLAAASTAS